MANVQLGSTTVKSIFLEHLHHAYAQTDGTYWFPNSREGDMLKQAKKEIEELEAEVKELVDEAYNVARCHN